MFLVQRVVEDGCWLRCTCLRRFSRALQRMQSSYFRNSVRSNTDLGSFPTYADTLSLAHCLVCTLGRRHSDCEPLVSRRRNRRPGDRRLETTRYRRQSCLSVSAFTPFDSRSSLAGWCCGLPSRLEPLMYTSRPTTSGSSPSPS